jgi:hypothetical protein
VKAGADLIGFEAGVSAADAVAATAKIAVSAAKARAIRLKMPPLHSVRRKDICRKGKTARQRVLFDGRNNTSRDMRVAHPVAVCYPASSTFAAWAGLNQGIDPAAKSAMNSSVKETCT